MARPKKRTTTEPSKPSTNPFVDALTFLSNVTKPIGPINETHVYLKNGFATASNGILSAGIKIEQELFACPQNHLMIEALSKCGQNLNITQLDNNRLSIKSDKFKAIVPCVDSELLVFSYPDSPVGEINNEFKKAIEILGIVPTDASERITAVSLLLNGQSLVGTNGTMIFEIWHGLNMPVLAIPKALIKPLSQIKKNITKFGFSINSFTIWFDDESWIKTQIMAGHWPEINNILDGPSNPFPLPGDFWPGLAAITPFAEEGLAYFGKERLSSHQTEGVGASFEVKGLVEGPVYPIRQLNLIKDLADTIDFIAPLEKGYCLRFFGKQARGVIAGRNKI